MMKARLAVLGLAVTGVALLATPASAAKTVFKATGKDINLVVTDCPASGPAGTTCLSWTVFAAQQRVLSDGTVTKSAFLQLDKYRIRLTSTGFTFKLVQSYTSDSVALDVEDALASASGAGTVPTATGKIDVKFALVANSPADSTRARIVQKFDDCR